MNYLLKDMNGLKRTSNQKDIKNLIQAHTHTSIMTDETMKGGINKMEDKLKIGIGTKEATTLKPMKLHILGMRIDTQKDGSGKQIGEKVICICKHPEKEDTIQVSKVRFEKKKKLTDSGLWFKQDEDGNIQKNSALAVFLSYLNARSVSDLEGKFCESVLDEDGYLCFKAY